MKHFFTNSDNIKYTNIKDFNENITDENVFIYFSSLENEFEVDLINYSKHLTKFISDMFLEIKSISQILIENQKKGKFFYIGINSAVRNVIEIPISPIKDEAIVALFKTLNKELSPFGIYFYPMLTEAFSEILTGTQKRSYRNDMKIFSSRKIPFQLDDIFARIEDISNDNGMLAGNLINIGAGVMTSY